MMNYFENAKVKAIEYSVCGQNHATIGLQNQDSVLAEILSDDVGYMVLADGVSSATYSKEGAIAATEVIRDLCYEISNIDIQNIDLEILKEKIVRQWKSRFKSQWNEYAATLNFLLYVSGTILIGQIGDGLIVLNVDGKNFIYTEMSEFYTSETDALCEQVRRSAFRLDRVPYKLGFKAYMVTDGIGKEIAEESRVDLGVYLNRMMDNSIDEIEDELKVWIDGLGKKNGDDKSIGYIRMEA